MSVTRVAVFPAFFRLSVPTPHMRFAPHRPASHAPSDERRTPIGRSGARRGPHHRARPFHLRNSNAFVTTLTLENAIAAPAITGFSQPSAASGTPIRL